MLVRENAENISLLIDRLFDFVKTDEEIQNDIPVYLNSFPDKFTSQAGVQTALLPYVFERKLENSDKKVIDLYIEKNTSLSKDELEILEGLSNSFLSVFEIEKVQKYGFDLLNLVNEKMYNTLTLVKMVHFRGVTAGQYIVGRIFPYKDAYYLIEIDNVLSSKSQDQAYRLAVLQQLENPEYLYDDNEEKLAEIQSIIDNMAVKFKEYFGKDELITTTTFVDDLLGNFNDYIENPEAEIDKNANDLIKLPDKFAFFEVKEMTSESGDILDAASKGFAGHERTYDVGVIFDKNIGLLVLPFYGTFREIFRSEDYKSIEGYKECILNYFESDKIPPLPVINAFSEDPDNFIKIVSEVLEIEGEFNLEELLHKYKSDYFAKRKFSSPTVLYSSKAFSMLMSSAEKPKSQHVPVNKEIGRNDPCPCGSGKKYKKCCLSEV